MVRSKYLVALIALVTALISVYAYIIRRDGVGGLATHREC